MTREEAINQLKINKEDDTYVIDDEALEMAIKALEQEPILDKIRAEIEHTIDYTYDSTDYDKALYNGAYKDGLYEALDIIDKYKAESEE